MTRQELNKACKEIFRNCEISESKRFCLGNYVAEIKLENGKPNLIIQEFKIEKLKID